MSQLASIHAPPPGHWVGDGFPVRSLFAYHDAAERVSPFLLLDYAAPHRFAPANHRRGVGTHPHRGIETVTIVYAGEVEHRDSTGAGGVIGPGDVQWMTAGAGILHQEFHSEAYRRSGGDFHMVQLWVNLRAADKLAPPGYQALSRDAIPVVELADGSGRLRVIAGEYAGQRGPARTFTPLQVWDIDLHPGGRLDVTLPPGQRGLVVALQGGLRLNDQQTLPPAHYAAFPREVQQLSLEAATSAKLLVLAGEPIDEPVAGYGPFVMNTAAEIQQALADLQNGKFGRIDNLG